MGEEGESTISGVAGEQVNLNIRCSHGQKFSVRSSLQLSVAEFKCVLARSSDVPAEQQRLIYKGRILKDDQSLDSYGKVYFDVGFSVDNHLRSSSHSTTPVL